jgi:threonine dehydrogenase-like Zn-dependent dehydrogenase
MAAAVWDAMGDLDRCTPSRDDAWAPSDSQGAKVGYPVAIGYNNVAEVVALGEGVEDIHVGQRVFTMARHIELFDVEPWEAVAIPPGVDDAAAAPAYIATLGLHALRRVQWQPGEPVVVIGLGLIGICAALVADACGAELVCIEPSAQRRGLVASLLPNARIHDPETPVSELTVGLTRRDLRVAIDAAGGELALHMAISILVPGGRVAVLALHPESLGPLLADAFYEREIALVSTSNDPYEPQEPDGFRPFTRNTNVSFMLGLVARGRLALERVCTHTFPVHDIARVYADLSSGSSPEIVGALLDWRASHDMNTEEA